MKKVLSMVLTFLLAVQLVLPVAAENTKYEDSTAPSTTQASDFTYPVESTDQEPPARPSNDNLSSEDVPVAEGEETYRDILPSEESLSIQAVDNTLSGTCGDQRQTFLQHPSKNFW